MAKQQQTSDQSPAPRSGGALGQVRTTLPPPANDNRGTSAARIVLAVVAAIVATVLGALALRPFG